MWSPPTTTARCASRRPAPDRRSKQHYQRWWPRDREAVRATYAMLDPAVQRPNCHRIATGGGEKARLYREAEVDDVAVLDDVVLALEPQLPRLAALGLAPEAHELVVGDHLGADEAALDVAVDLARRLEGRRAAADRPGPALVLAGGEEADQVEERVAGADEAGACALGEAQVGQERVPVGGLELGDLGLEPGGERHRLGALGTGTGGDLLRERHRGRRLGHVRSEEHTSEREEREAGEQRPLFGREAEGAERRTRLERRRQALEQHPLALVAFLLLEPLEALLDDGQVGEHELGGEALQVRGRGGR